MTRATLLLVIGYVLLLSAAVGGVVEARRRTLASQSSPESQAAWKAWRDKTRELSTSNDPMKRREAKAPEPPLLILLRDHFGAAVGSTVVAVTLFYWFLAFLIRGSLRTPPVRGMPPSETAA
jgi:hypothetical protein